MCGRKPGSLRAAVRKAKDRFDSHLANRLIAFMVGIVTLTLLSVVMTSYVIIRRQSEQGVVTDASNNLKLVNSNIGDYLAGIRSQAIPLNNYDAFTNAVRNESDDYTQKVYLESYLSSLYYTRTDFSEIDLYILSDNRRYSISRPDMFGGVHIDEASVRGQPWFSRIAGSSPFYMEPAVSAEAKNGGFLTLYYAFTPIGNSNPIAVVCFHVSGTGVGSMWENIIKSGGESVYLVQNNGQLLYTQNATGWAALHGSARFSSILHARTNGRFALWSGSRRSLVLYDVGDGGAERLIAVIPYQDIYSAARAASTVSLTVGLFFLVLSVVLIAFIARAITRPLQTLSREMDAFGSGNLDVTLRVTGHDEIAQAQRRFVGMSQSIRSLINDRYRLKLAEKSAMLKALEAEINPHFLYNALQTISTMALKNGVPQVSDMVGHLALFLRYCIGSSETVCVDEEIGHIRDYMSIQTARFGKRLRIQYELDPTAGEARIPRLSLQTLVENSIKHALERSSGTLTITVRTRATKGWAVLNVSDDGRGMEPARFAQVLASLEAQRDEAGGEQHIGLRNLSSRLRLSFGQASRLYVVTSPRGTRVFFAVPAATGTQSPGREGSLL